MPTRPGQYRFYGDVELGDVSAAHDALGALESEATEVKLFGCYPAAE